MNLYRLLLIYIAPIFPYYRFNIIAIYILYIGGDININDTTALSRNFESYAIDIERKKVNLRSCI